MLRALQIENYALISSLNIQFDDGYTVITGETGAGKSIIMGALALILGNRADSSVLFDKSRKCIVEAEFDIVRLPIKIFFEENNLDYHDITIIRREITENGKSRAFINDTPVNLQTLKELTSQLIDIHSQHQNLLFQVADFRVHVLDQFAQIQKDLAQYHSYLSDYKRYDNDLQTLLEKQKSQLEKKDFWEFVLNELTDAKLIENEQEEAEQKIDFLTHAETIKGNLFQSLQILSEQESSILGQLREVNSLCGAIAPYSAEIEQLSKRLESNYIEIKDIISEVSALENKAEFDPNELERLKERMDLIYSLQLKHHVNSVAELLEKKEAISQELSAFSDDEEKIVALKQQKSEAQLKAEAQAKYLSVQRKKIIPVLEKQVTNKIHLLGMTDGQFVVKISETDALQKNGIDNVQFFFSANKGVALSELDKVASGGEISRLMLAVKSTLSDKTVLPTVIFDEIDVGISGEIAGKVAHLMKEMSLSRQLLVITHLPQIAAHGKVHYQVYKEVVENKSYTKIKKLEKDERAVEIAKMMSGDKWSDAALLAAQELIAK